MPRELELKCQIPNGNALRHELTLMGYDLPKQEFQLNHYFEPNGNLHADNMSVRARQIDDNKPTLIFKFGADPINGSDRLEQEYATEWLSIDELGFNLCKSGMFQEHSKWARYRRKIHIEQLGVELCIDLNSGYGLLAELEAKQGWVTMPHLQNVARTLGLIALPDEMLRYMYQQVLDAKGAYYREFIQNGAKAMFARRS